MGPSTFVTAPRRKWIYRKNESPIHSLDIEPSRRNRKIRKIGTLTERIEFDVVDRSGIKHETEDELYRSKTAAIDKTEIKYDLQTL